MKILRDVTIQCDHVIEARRPHIVLIEKGEKISRIIDVAFQKIVKYMKKHNSYSSGGWCIRLCDKEFGQVDGETGTRIGKEFLHTKKPNY